MFSPTTPDPRNKEFPDISAKALHRSSTVKTLDIPESYKKWLIRVDRFIAFCAGLGQGAVVGIACASISAFAVLGWPFFLAVGIAGFLANFLFVYWGKIEKVWKYILHMYSNGIPPKMIVSSVLIVSAGLAVSAITMLSMFSAFKYLFIALGVACPPAVLYLIAGYIAFVTFFVVASMMFNSIFEWINADHTAHGFFRLLFTPPPDARNKFEAWTRVVIRGVLFVLALILVVYGTFMTLGAWSNSLTKIFEMIPRADQFLCYVFGLIVGMVLTGMGRIPMVMQNAIRVFWMIGEKIAKAIFDFCIAPLDTLKQGWKAIKEFFEDHQTKDGHGVLYVLFFNVIARGLNIVGNGAVSGEGAHVTISAMLQPRTSHFHIENRLDPETQAAIENPAVVGGSAVSSIFVVDAPELPDVETYNPEYNEGRFLQTPAVGGARP